MNPPMNSMDDGSAEQPAGTLVFLIGMLDKPSWGQMSIGPGSMERVYHQLMVQHVSAAGQRAVAAIAS